MLSSKTWNRKRDLTHNRCLEVECQHQAFSSEERQKERNRPLYSSSAPLHSPMVNTPRDSREWNLWHLLISRSFQEGCREDNEVSWAGSDQRGCRPHQEAVPLVRTKNSKLNEELSKPVRLYSCFSQLLQATMVLFLSLSIVWISHACLSGYHKPTTAANQSEKKKYQKKPHNNCNKVY